MHIEMPTFNFRIPAGHRNRKSAASTVVKEIAAHENEAIHWTPDSWRSKYAAQAVEYRDAYALEDVCLSLKQLPPLVSRLEIEQARVRFYHVALGRGFIIQGGDCAESFHDIQHDIIHRKVDLLHQQSQILEDAIGKPVIPLGRIAGQYAKPRSNPLEVLPSGETVHAFRGHIINSEGLEDRNPDPKRLMLGYFYAAATQNSIRHVTGLANSVPGKAFNKCHLYTSHEALHLPYESALTHDSYNLSATSIWLGERTRQLDGAHVEYARGLRNPIGVKIGPKATAADVIALLDTLAPDTAQYGKVTIITRMGRDKVRQVLPTIIRAVQLSGHVPVWMCDPCHGNTFTTSEGIKTRKVKDLLAELKETYAVHRSLESHLGGIHLEQTGDDVTECLGGPSCENEGDLNSCYESLCDPRLSGEQALDLVQRFAEFVKAFS
ncbi:hypothetical protein J7337_013061 [Fusarium musae]|uniref:Phospho-2-dehydro-3-deoxyheptonate aldolase n=1 Tax=Fusarium musae TaxID=1042133 RepID=A0A9P8D3X7_9HYPO|nr:hypothetical protein J7337_013061 [Fusarium musae]KAG9494832.1 hypothetical protein J7337_013061 [Fusarium musae]